MTLLEGRRGLVVGIANDRSIAHGIARAAHQTGLARAGTVVLAVRDREIGAAAASLAAAVDWSGRVALHLSGALTAAALEPLLLDCGQASLRGVNILIS